MKSGEFLALAGAVALGVTIGMLVSHVVQNKLLGMPTVTAPAK